MTVLVLVAFASPSWAQSKSATDELRGLLKSECASGAVDADACTTLSNCLELPALCTSEVEPEPGSVWGAAVGLEALAEGEALGAEGEGGAAAAMASGTASYVYGYDARKRLVRVAYNGTEVRFSYDKNGNRTAVSVPEPSLDTRTAGVFVLLIIYFGACRRSASPALRPLRDCRGVGLLTTLLFALAFSGQALAQSSPGYYAVEAPGASIVLGQSGNAVAAAVGAPAASACVPSVGGWARDITPEIDMLAEALKNDVDLIYEFVRDEIEFDPIWGSHKGAHGTLIDRNRSTNPMFCISGT